MTANISGDVWLSWTDRAALCADVLADCPFSLVGFQEFGATSHPSTATARENYGCRGSKANVS